MVAGATFTNREGNQVERVSKIISMHMRRTNSIRKLVGKDLAVLILDSPIKLECGISVVDLPPVDGFKPSSDQHYKTQKSPLMILCYFSQVEQDAHCLAGARFPAGIIGTL